MPGVLGGNLLLNHRDDTGDALPTRTVLRTAVYDVPHKVLGG